MQETETNATETNEQKTKLSHIVLCGDGKFKQIDNFSMPKAIKIKCTDCMGYECDPRKECTDKKCALYPFRGFYRDVLTSKIKEKPTEEQIQKRLANFKGKRNPFKAK